MKLYLLSPEGVPPNPHLFPMWTPTWIENGCSIVDRIEDCDVVLFDLHTRIAGYNQSDINYIIRSDIAVASFDEWDRGGMSSDEWPHPLTEQQSHALIGAKCIHFSRLLDKGKKYYVPIYPYEKPILHEEPLLTPDELFNREYDVVFIANQSQSRERIAEALQQNIRLKTFISIGAEKRPFDEFLNWHKRGKLFISSGAGGFTDERKQYLFSIAGLIQEDHNQLLLHPHTHLENCIKISNPPTKEDLDCIFAIVSNKEKLYEIHLNNYNFMKQYYSASYIANYILNTLRKENIL